MKSVKLAKPAKPTKSAKPVKSAGPIKKAAPVKSVKKATTVKATKQKNTVSKVASTTKLKVPSKSLPKSSSVRKQAAPIRSSKVKTAKIQPKTKIKTPISLVIAPPPPEPARRQVSSGVLRAFEQAVKIFNRKQFAEAKPMFENLQNRFPAEVEILARAQIYIQVCDQRMTHTPSLPRSADELYDRGVYALNIGDFTQARSFFERALNLRPDEPYLLYSLAATHAQTGSHDQALDYLKRSIQIQPRFRSQALNDSDFSGLRENKRFLELLGLASPFDLLESRR